MAVTLPVELTVATAVLATDHVPPAVPVEVKAVVVPEHMVRAPEIVPLVAEGFTVIG